MAQPICVITGVGPGTGTALARRFASGGYQVAMLARSAQRLARSRRRCPAPGLSLRRVGPEPGRRHRRCDRTRPGRAVGGDPQRRRRRLRRLPGDRSDGAEPQLPGQHHGAAPSRPAPRAGDDRGGRGRDPRDRQHLRLRGKADFAGFAPTKAAQRILAESIARDLGPKGVHVAYLAIDAVIDVPWTREQFEDKPDDFFIQPAAIADEIWHVAHQDRCAWSFDVELRPYGEHLVARRPGR